MWCNCRWITSKSLHYFITVSLLLNWLFSLFSFFHHVLWLDSFFSEIRRTNKPNNKDLIVFLSQIFLRYGMIWDLQRWFISKKYFTKNSWIILYISLAWTWAICFSLFWHFPDYILILFIFGLLCGFNMKSFPLIIDFHYCGDN